MLNEIVNLLKAVKAGLNVPCSISVEWVEDLNGLQFTVKWMNQNKSLRSTLRVNVLESTIREGLIEEQLIIEFLINQINEQIGLAEGPGDQYQKGLVKTRHTGAKVGRSRFDRAETRG